MGYRSDVGVVFYATLKDKEGVVKLWLRENLPFDDWSEEDFEEIDDGYKFHVSDVKWYDGYPDIERFTEVKDKFVELFCDKDPCAACESVRIGEEDDDVEVERVGDHEYRVTVSRSICLD